MQQARGRTRKELRWVKMPCHIPRHLIFTCTRSRGVAGIRLLAAWLANPNPNRPSSHPARSKWKKGKSKPERKLSALSTHRVKRSVEESAPGKQRLRVNRQVNAESQELVSVLPACNRGNARRRLQWIGLFINDAWRDLEVCKGRAVAGSENAWRYSFSQAPRPHFPQPKISPKMRGNGRFLLGLRRTFLGFQLHSRKMRNEPCCAYIRRAPLLYFVSFCAQQVQKSCYLNKKRGQDSPIWNQGALALASVKMVGAGHTRGFWFMHPVGNFGTFVYN